MALAKRRRILFQLNGLGYGGTEKAIYSICRTLNRQLYEPYLFFHTDVNTPKYYVKKALQYISGKHAASYKERYVTNFARLAEFRQLLGKEHVLLGSSTEFLAAVQSVNPDVIHFNRGLYRDFYTDLVGQLPSHIRLIETNIFGLDAPEAYLARLSAIGFVSDWCYSRADWDGGKGFVLYNPIAAPIKESGKSLRVELGISVSAIVLGRISRPGMDDGQFVIEVYKQLATSGLEKSALHMLVLGASPALRALSETEPGIHILEPTTEEGRVSAFYQAIDVLVHYRIEGETFGMNIAEAMMHGKAVISHVSELDNAQVELLTGPGFEPCGVILPKAEPVAYAKTLAQMISNPALLTKLGQAGKEKAVLLYSETAVMARLESYYAS
jgi:glycosyltransferase involved in cell wall biosynthesis